MTTVTVELPDALVELLGSAESLAVQARRALVLDLLRQGQVSQGKAARLLGLTRYDILDLMAEYEIPSGPLTAEEMREESAAVRRLAESGAVGARGQR